LPITLIRTRMTKTMTKNTPMTKNTKDSIERTRPRREFADVSVIVTTVTLFESLVITATTEAISIARADTLVPIADYSGGRLALAVLMALVIASLGGLTAVMTTAAKHRHAGIRWVEWYGAAR
jgi:hypothetical protein